MPDLVTTVNSVGRKKLLHQFEVARMVTKPSDFATYTGSLTELMSPDGNSYGLITTALPPNNKTIFASAFAGKCWVRKLVTEINVFEFINVDASDHTTGLQDAITFACAANNPDGLILTKHGYTSSQLVFPFHRYIVSNELNVKGAVSMRLMSGLSYSGARIIQTAPNKHLFRLTKDIDGHSNCLHIMGGSLRAGYQGESPTAALIYGGDGSESTDAMNNSIYLENVWLCTPEKIGVWLQRGDDFRASFCTFDVSSFQAIRLGGDTVDKQVSNAQIVHNTFFDNFGGTLDFYNVKRTLVESNRFYNQDSEPRSPFALRVSAGTADLVQDIDLTNNRTHNVNKLIETKFPGVNINGNRGTRCLGRWIEIGGGATASGLEITHNRASGDFSGVVAGAGNAPDAPLFCYGTGILDSRIESNTFINTGAVASSTPILMSDSRTVNNYLSGNRSSGFSNSGQIANPLQNNSELIVDISTTTISSIATNSTVGQRTAVTGVLPGDQITLTDKATSWSSAAGICWSAYSGAPNEVALVCQNFSGSTRSVAAVNFKLRIYRRM